MGRERPLAAMGENRVIDQVIDGEEITMRIFSNENGGVRFKVFLWFVFLFLVAHVAFKIVPLYMDYTRMKDEMSTKASFAQILTDDQIMGDLQKKANELELPLVQARFFLKRDGHTQKMEISHTWNIELRFL